MKGFPEKIVEGHWTRWVCQAERFSNFTKKAFTLKIKKKIMIFAVKQYFVDDEEANFRPLENWAA